MISEFFPLQLFPPGALSSSVITTVWVGVMVIAFFNLRFGWVRSGLVVPGYVVPLLLVKPVSGAVVIVEGLVTYAIVRFYSEKVTRWYGGSNFFGRDRFFALVLCSILVRTVFDGWLLPILGETLVRDYGIIFDYRNTLHSFGLIIVALIANQFWKTGLARGAFPFAATLATTYFLVRYGLMEFTNFNMASLSYMYEDVAASILASPKTYIVLVSAAFIASRMNLKYAWEFNGILIPALLALQWYQPLRIVTSFAEAFIVLGISVLILRIPIFRQATIEGSRKLVLFFNVSFFYKIVLGYLILYLRPEWKVSDFYGFGYLLPTLMAIKMHDKEIIARLTRSTLQTSLAAVGFATLLGFGLSFLPDAWTWATPVAVEDTEVRTESDADVVDVIRAAKVSVYRSRVPDSVPVPLPGEIDAFANGLRLVRQFRETSDPDHLRLAAESLARAGYGVRLVGTKHLVLEERGDPRGWGIYAVNLQTESRLTVEVPAPLEEWGTLEAGASLLDVLSARSLAVSGSGRATNSDGSSDVLRNPQTYFNVFHRVMDRGAALSVRGYTRDSVRILEGIRPEQNQIDIPEPPSTLWVSDRIPEDLSLRQLEGFIDRYSVKWGRTPFPNQQRDITRRGFTELYLDRPARRKLLFRRLETERRTHVQERMLQIDGYLQERLLTDKKSIAPRGSDLYRPPRLEELLYLDEEILTPLLQIVSRQVTSDAWTESTFRLLDTIAAAASNLSYELILYRHKSTGNEYVVLTEKFTDKPALHWGTYVFRLGLSSGYVVEVPRPLYELNTFEYGISLFDRSDGTALLVAGSHPYANRDRSSDVVRLTNRRSVFSLVNQSVIRSLRDRALMVVQIRAFVTRRGGPRPSADVLAAFDDGVVNREHASPLASTLLQRMDRDGLVVKLVDGNEETVGYESHLAAQRHYTATTPGKEFCILWLDAVTRYAYRQQVENESQAAQFQALGIHSREIDLFQTVERELSDVGSAPVSDKFRAAVTNYTATLNIIALQNILRDFPEYKIERWLEVNTGQAFLGVRAADGALGAVANLFPQAAERAFHLKTFRRAVLTEFVDSRAGWLLLGDEE